MLHEQWERQEKLTIHNATKDQLKFMVKNRDMLIKQLYQELECKQKELDEALGLLNTQMNGRF